MKRTKPRERLRQSADAPSRNPSLLNLIATAITLGLPITIAAQSLSLPKVPLVEDPPSLVSTAAAIVLATIINSLFVAADTAIDLLRYGHIKAYEKDIRRSTLIQRLLQDKSSFHATCALGSQTMRAWIIILSFLPAPALAHQMANLGWLNYGWESVMLAFVLITIPVSAVNMVFGELVPSSFASVHPSLVAVRLAGFIKLTTLFFALPGKLLTRSAGMVTRRFGASATFSLVNQAEEEIKSLVETAQESGEIEEKEKELLHSVFDFTDTVAREVMTPRVDMDAVPIDTDPAAIVAIIQETGHSRIPVFEETDDQIIGIIHAKDLLMSRVYGDKSLNLRTILHPALFVPENKNLHDLLREMRTSRTQMAIVQDEFGGTAGIVTTEDIVEELVGDIVDEYDVESPDIVQVGDDYLVDGRVNIDDLNDEIGSNFDSDEFDTVGGYVFGLFGRQPKVGDTIVDSGFHFEIEDTDGRRIKRLRLMRDEVSEPEQLNQEYSGK